MTSILPSARTPFDVIGADVGQALQHVLPQAIQRGVERKQGLTAIDQLQQQLEAAGGDINKMLPALARAYTLNPALERSGLGQTFLQQAKVGRAFPGQSAIPQGGPEQLPGGGPNVHLQTEGMPQEPSTFATPGAFNIMTPEEINQEAVRYAQAVQDPNAFATRQAQLQNQNNIANEQRTALEEMALRSNVKPAELSRFMQVGAKFDPRNPSEWAQKTRREFDKVKANDTKIQNAFIPGLGSGLLGRDRDAALKRIGPAVQDNIKAGLEQETRNYLADQYVSPTEIAELVHPLTPQKEKALKALPNGVFEKQPSTLTKFSPTFSYEEALEKAPKELAQMQKNLADFFLKNVDKDTSLLPLRYKLWDEKNYDWRQIGPAIREAESRGLKLTTPQSTEMTEIETQPPRQSLPDLFQSLGRVVQYFRGQK